MALIDPECCESALAAATFDSTQGLYAFADARTKENHEPYGRAPPRVAPALINVTI